LDGGSPDVCYQTLLRHGLRTILDLEPGLTVVGEAANGEEAVNQAVALRPDIVLMDIQMPRRSGEPASSCGVEATALILAACPETRVVVLTTFDYEEFVMYADHHHDDRLAFWCAAPAGVQGALVASDPDRFFRPPYVGHRGWLGAWLDVPVDWDEIAEIVIDAYRMVAPRKLLDELDRSNRTASGIVT
jgi:CheY-like chemotaxis protein